MKNAGNQENRAGLVVVCTALLAGVGCTPEMGQVFESMGGGKANPRVTLDIEPATGKLKYYSSKDVDLQAKGVKFGLIGRNLQQLEIAELGLRSNASDPRQVDVQRTLAEAKLWEAVGVTLSSVIAAGGQAAQPWVPRYVPAAPVPGGAGLLGLDWGALLADPGVRALVEVELRRRGVSVPAGPAHER